MSENKSLPKRYEALDALRGFCACMIVFFHFNGLTISHLENFSFVTNAHIFVDFFFVLSGFVITMSYKDKILQGLPFSHYIMLRLGRIYPVHIFILGGFVALECLKFFMTSEFPPFTQKDRSITALVANIFLVHGMGVFDYLTWNLPSWSISVEFFTYIVFALAVWILRKNIWIFAMIVTLAAPVIFLNLDPSLSALGHGRAFFVCLSGFCAGILAYYAHDYLKKLNLDTFRYSTIIELIAVIATVLFVVFGNRTAWIFCPLIFSLVVLVFS